MKKCTHAKTPKSSAAGRAFAPDSAGNNREPCFYADEDCRFYPEWLEAYARDAGCALHAYVLMNNHVHLLSTSSTTGGAGAMMKRLGQRYVQYVNRTYRRSGTLWEGRFRSCLTQEEPYVLGCYRYIEALACEQLSYRDKLRLAQLLIQAARKEEEEANPENRASSGEQFGIKAFKNKKEAKANEIEYVIERLRKLKPAKKTSVINSIKAMYQFQGGISDLDVERIISILQKKKYIVIENNKVTFK